MPKRRTAFYTARMAVEPRLTQDELSRRSGVAQGVISDLETGRLKNPTWDVLSRLAQILGVRPDQLVPPAKLPKYKYRPLAPRIIAQPLYVSEATV